MFPAPRIHIQCVIIGRKMACLGTFWQILNPRSAIYGTCSWPPLLSFVLKICVIVFHTHRYHPPKIWHNPDHRSRFLIPPHHFTLSCLLLAGCCCLLSLLLKRVGAQYMLTKEAENSPSRLF